MVWSPKGKDVFVSSDGDNIGSHVAAAILSGNIAKAKKLSLLINLGGKITDKFARSQWGGKTIIMGGDDLMIQSSKDKFDPAKVDVMRKLYHSKIKATLSCGIGSTPEEAMKAIVIAKNTGKNKAVFWTDDMESTYKRVVKERINNLKTKLRAAGGSPKLTESSEIPPELRDHVRTELKKLLRERKRRNKKLASKKASRPARPVKKGPSKADTAAQKKKQKEKAMHGPNMVDTMRTFILKHRAAQISDHRKADWLAQNGHESEAKAVRMRAKLRAVAMMKDHAVLHTAGQIKDPEHLPASLKSKVAMLKKRIPAVTKLPRVARGQLKRKSGDRQLTAKFRKVARGQLNMKPVDRQLHSRSVHAPVARVKPVAPKPPESVKPVHPAHTPNPHKPHKLQKPPSLVKRPFGKNRNNKKFRRRK